MKHLNLEILLFMTDVKVSIKNKENHPLVATLLALLLVGLCIWASSWQYSRGVARHAMNARIATHVLQNPVDFSTIAKDINAAEWRKVSVQGTFDSSHQILLRNRYSEGKYGFDLLTLFTARSGEVFWVDRGWIAPGKNATLTPELPKTTSSEVQILGRVRLDHWLPQGSFFAISARNKLVPQWNAQAKYSQETQKYYLDLLDSNSVELVPASPVELPDLSDGPHMAYALQWLFFAGLVIYARIRLRRGR